MSDNVSSPSEPQKNYSDRARWGMRILVGAALTAAACAGIQAVRCRRAVHDATTRLASYSVKTVHLNYGEIAYLDTVPADASSTSANPAVILSLHGLYGGYDQAIKNVGDLAERYRIIAPSRFGYPSSAVAGEGTPKEQAAALMALLDILNIEQVYVLGASAGGTPAIRFALDYPERTAGLILLSATSPWDEKPQSPPARLGPAGILNHDYAMWLLFPFFKPLFGLPTNTIDGMLPLRERREGADIDAAITNLDMAVHGEDYPIETLKLPVLLLHAQDDRIAPFNRVQDSLYRYPNLTTVIFETGGHLIEGHPGEVTQTVTDFIDNTR